MDTVKCTKCCGKKKLLGNGMMKKECPSCHGSGYELREKIQEAVKAKAEVKKKKTAKLEEVAEKKTFHTDDNKLINGGKA